MSVETVSAALALAASRPDDCFFVGPQPESTLREAERLLSRTLPPGYRHFLATVGAGGVAGLEIYGVLGSDFETAGVPDAVWLNLKLRAECQLRPSVLIIASTGFGPYYALDFSADEREPPVVVVDSSGKVLDADSRDFGSFLMKKISILRRR
jgi:hypothetical protein